MDKAVFLDRDGVINEMSYFHEHGFVDTPFTLSQLKIFKGVPKAIHQLNKLGFKVIIISNQPGIGKKHFTEETFKKISKKIHSEIKKHGGFIDSEYYCFHHPDSKLKKYRKICSCRKPKVGLVQKAIHENNIDLKKSFFIGDGIVDMILAKKMKINGIFVGNVNSTVLKLFNEHDLTPLYISHSLLEAVEFIQNSRIFKEPKN